MIPLMHRLFHPKKAMGINYRSLILFMAASQVVVWSLYAWMVFPTTPLISGRWTNLVSWSLFSVTGMVIAETSLIRQRLKEGKVAYSLFLIERASCLAIGILITVVASRRAYDFRRLSVKGVLDFPYSVYSLGELFSFAVTLYFLLYLLVRSHKKSFMYALPLLVWYLLWFNPSPSGKEAAIFKSSYSAAFLRFSILVVILIAYSVIVKKKPLDRGLQWILAGFFMMFMLSYMHTTRFPVFAFEARIAFFPFRLLVYSFWVAVLFRKYQELYGRTHNSSVRV